MTMSREERTARISALWDQLRQERLASIRDDLADLGHPAATTITAHYHLSEEYGWPVLDRLEADEQDVPGFMGSDAQDTLNALLIEDYDPDQGDASMVFSFEGLPELN